MKKLLFILLSVALAVFSLAACDQNNSTDLGFLENSASSSVNSSSSATEENSSSSETEEEELPSIEGGVENEDSGSQGSGNGNPGAFWSPFL